jgi:hypothetical protein
LILDNTTRISAWDGGQKSNAVAVANIILGPACHIETFGYFLIKVLQWGSTIGNAATVAHSTKRKQSGKDSVMEGQPLLLFM